MKRFPLAALALILLTTGTGSFAAAARFEKVTDHVYWLQLQPDGPSYTVVATGGGVLLVNPPAQPQLAEVLTALKKVTSKPVNWVVNTDYVYERNGGSAELAKQGAAILESKELQRLFQSPAKSDSPAAPAEAKEKGNVSGEKGTESAGKFVFGRQARLFPDNLEVRVFALQFKAHTAGDVVVYIPVEKVLIVGDLFIDGAYPAIDREGGGGSALGWYDGMRQVIDGVPLLKSAMPQPRPDPAKPPPEEKTLEEMVVVVPGQGARTDLQVMKKFLESSQKLRNELSRAVTSGRNLDYILSSPALGPQRAYANFEAFATHLFEELVAQKTK